MKTTALKSTFYLFILLPTMIAAPPCLAAPSEFRFSIFLDGGTANIAPLPGDLTVTLGGNALTVSAVEPLPADAPVLFVLDATSLSTSELRQARKALTETTAELKRQGISWTVSVIDPQQAAPVNVTIDSALLQSTLTSLSSTLAEGGVRPLRDTFLSNLDRIGRAIKDTSDQDPYLRVVLIGRDTPSLSDERDEVERQIFANLIHFVANRGVSFYLLDFGGGGGGGFFTRLASDVGGKVIGGSGQNTGIFGTLSADQPKSYIVTVRQEKARYYYRPVPLSIRSKNSALLAESLRGPRLFWPLPPQQKLVTYANLREAIALRQQWVEPTKPEELSASSSTAQRIVELSPFTLDDRLRLIRLDEKAKTFDQAHLTIEQSIQLFPDSWELPSERGAIYEAQNDYPHAIEWFEAALNMKTANHEIDLRLARLNVKAKRTVEAVARYDKVLGSELDSAQLRSELAGVLWSSGSVERAEKEALRAVQLDRRFLPAHDLLIEIYQKKGDHIASLQAAQDALAEDPRHYPALHAAGLTLSELGRYREALFFLEMALGDAPRDFDLHYALYRSFDGLNRPEEAFKSLRTAISIDERRPQPYVDLAELHRKRGDFLSAGRALEEGAAKTPGSSSLYEALAGWSVRRGNLDKAITSYRAAAGMASPEERGKLSSQIGLLTLTKGGALREALGSFTEAGFSLHSGVTEKIEGQRERLRREESERSALPKLVLPGGIEPLLRFAPHLQGRLRDKTFISSLFAYLLSEASNPKQPLNSPRLRLIAFYREYLKFKNWLVREHLYSPELTLSFTERKEDQKLAAHVLSYFDVKVKSGRDKTSGEALILEANERGKEERRLLLKMLGLNPALVKENTTFKFVLRDEEIPVSLGADYWLKEVIGAKAAAPDEALLAWLEEPDALQLYTILESLPDEGRLWLTRTIPAKELLEDFLPSLTAFSGMLRFNSDGSLHLPGGKEGEKIWMSMVGASPTADPRSFLKKLFMKDEGRLIYYFSALSSAPPEVESFIHSSPARFAKFYAQTAEYKIYKRAWPGRNYFDLADLLWHLEVERGGGGVSFPGTERMWAVAAAGSSHGKSAGDLARLDKVISKRVKFKVDEDVLLALMKSSGEKNKFSGVRKYIAFKHLAEERPGLLDERTGLALELGYDRFGGQYPLVAGLGMDSETLLKFLGRLGEFEKIMPAEKRRTGIALFQSGFVLLHLLAGNGTISRDEAHRLSVEFLDLQYPINSPGAEAFEISVFLSRRLLPLLEAKTGGAERGGEQEGDLFVRGLAGPRTDFSFVWNDQAYEVNFARREADRIESFLERQSLPALEPLVDLFSKLQRLAGSPNRAAFDQINESSQSLSDTQIESGRSDAYRKAIVHTDAKSLRAEMQKLGRAVQRNKFGQMSGPLLAVFDELAPYLAESMTGLVYAAEVTRDDMVSQADKDFVRKHDFAMDEESRKQGLNPWGKPDVVRDDEMGVRVRGSLVDLSAALAKIRGRQVEGGARTRFTDEAFPVAQRVATALINPGELNDETIEYAATCMDLSETLLSAVVVDGRIESFVDEFISRRLGAKRASLIRELIRAGEPGRAARVFLPSELYCMGDEFYRLHSGETEYRWQFQEVRRLGELKAKVTAANLNQLGFPALSWYGVNTLSLESVAPVEAIATYWEPRRLAERSCELKLHLARLFWRTGMPAALFKPVAESVVERALKEVAQSSGQDWRAMTDAVQAIDEETVLKTVAEIAQPKQK